jgi:hypothetical protein
MPFGLKNAGATYKRMMDKVFAEMRGKEVEVYIDYMIVKTKDDEDPSKDLEYNFQCLRQYNLRLNPLKCTFGMEAGKFLGFMLTSHGIEANPDKFQEILDMTSPRTIKDVQQLTGRIAALSRFLPTSVKRCLPMFKILKKQDSFNWTEECEDAFRELKVSLASHPVLTKPIADDTLIVAFALLVASRKLRPYFQCYPILVRTNQPIWQILHKPDLAGRMMS